MNSTNIRISGQFINAIGTNLKPDNKEDVYDCEGLLMIPGFINSHTHVGDSIGKDIGLDFGVEEKIHPSIGIKQKILTNSQASHLTSFIRNSCLS
ncbi:MAG: cytosine deaminase, partial [Thaumarchaeota archaeon]|nr:cytosine deaminase [Nitrososphaerota archaeon]